MSLGMAEAIGAPAAAVARTNSGIACAIILYCFHTNQRFIHGIFAIFLSPVAFKNKVKNLYINYSFLIYFYKL